MKIITSLCEYLEHFKRKSLSNSFPRGFLAHFESPPLVGHFQNFPKQVILSESKVNWIIRHSSTFYDVDQKSSFILVLTYGRPTNTSKA